MFLVRLRLSMINIRSTNTWCRMLRKSQSERSNRNTRLVKPNINTYLRVYAGKMLLKFCKQILFLPTRKFALPYCCFLILLSIVCHLFPVPPSYFSNSKNVLNVLFMKFSYYYTIAFLLPFVFCLNLVYGFGKLKRTIVPVVRQIVNFGILYFLSWEFNIYGSLVGLCVDSTANSTTPVTDFENQEFTCEWYGYKWKSLDISGHIYHNIYGVLIIMEEASAYKLWELVELVVDTVIRDKVLWKLVNHIIDEEIGVEEKATLLKWYGKLSMFLKINFCALAVLWICLNVANILTAIYFHTIIENIIAACAALIFWLLCYRVVFPLYGTHPKSLEAHSDILETKDEETETFKTKDQKTYSSF